MRFSVETHRLRTLLHRLRLLGIPAAARRRERPWVAVSRVQAEAAAGSAANTQPPESGCMGSDGAGRDTWTPVVASLWLRASSGAVG